MRLLFALSLVALLASPTHAESLVDAFADRNAWVVVSMDVPTIVKQLSAQEKLRAIFPPEHQKMADELLDATGPLRIAKVLESHKAEEAMFSMSLLTLLQDESSLTPIFQTQLMVSFASPENAFKCYNQLQPTMHRTGLALSSINANVLCISKTRDWEEPTPSLRFLLDNNVVEPLSRIRKSSPVGAVISPHVEFLPAEERPQLPSWLIEALDFKSRMNLERVEVGVDYAAGKAHLLWRVANGEKSSELLQALRTRIEQWTNQSLESLGNKEPIRFDEVAEYREVDEGLQMTVDFNSSAARKLVWATLGKRAVEARQEIDQSRRINNLKYLALTMLIYKDHHTRLPAPNAIVDKDGKPLLSWRVAILPLLEEHLRIDAFRLDEAWDSEHNLRVAKNMPSVFADPARPDLAEQGLTTIQMPIIDEPRQTGRDDSPQKRRQGGKIFYLQHGVDIASIRDGTSNTILCVEVAPEHAVPWTKPVDWTVDRSNPKAQLIDESRAEFAAAFHDGQARVIKLSLDPETLIALCTKSGGEEVYTDDLD